MIKRTERPSYSQKSSKVNLKNEKRAIDYKNIELLKKFTDSYGRINGKKRSGVNAREQRNVSLAIKHARYLALLPYIAK